MIHFPMFLLVGGNGKRRWFWPKSVKITLGPTKGYLSWDALTGGEPK